MFNFKQKRMYLYNNETIEYKLLFFCNSIKKFTVIFLGTFSLIIHITCL